jgi:hypothetical protein
MNDLEFSRLLFRLKKAKGDNEKAELYASLSEESKELADYHRQRDPDYVTPFTFETDGSF